MQLIPDSPINQKTGCVAGAVNRSGLLYIPCASPDLQSRQILLNYGPYSCNFDALLKYSATRIANQDPVSTDKVSPLDSLFGDTFKPAVQGGMIHVSFLCQKLLFTIFNGGADQGPLWGPYLCPLLLRSQSMADYWSQIAV